MTVYSPALCQCITIEVQQIRILQNVYIIKKIIFKTNIR